VGAGRPTDYKEEYNDQVYKLCLLGAIDREIANFFDISESTLNLWKKEHTEFSESITRGKKIADMEVAQSLYDTTKDRQVVKQQAFKTKSISYQDGKRIEHEEIQIVDVLDVIPADFRSIQFWLKNRRGKPEHGQRWADKQEIDHTTKGESVNPFDASKLTSEERQILIKAIRAQKNGSDS